MMVLFIEDGDRELPIAIYPNGVPYDLVDKHLETACERGLPAWRYKLVPVPVLYLDGVLYVPAGQEYPVNATLREVRDPLFLL